MHIIYIDEKKQNQLLDKEAIYNLSEPEYKEVKADWRRIYL
ncbi:hypothetical protein [Variimorphobacter saccharofermentans]|nr:hypothetical protein [Variimorphobacter saccharofermentans]